VVVGRVRGRGGGSFEAGQAHGAIGSETESG